MKKNYFLLLTCFILFAISFSFLSCSKDYIEDVEITTEVTDEASFRRAIPDPEPYEYPAYYVHATCGNSENQ